MARLLPCSQLSLLSKSESVYRVGIQLVVCFCTIREIDVKGERRERERERCRPIHKFVRVVAR